MLGGEANVSRGIAGDKVWLEVMSLVSQSRLIWWGIGANVTLKTEQRKKRLLTGSNLIGVRNRGVYLGPPGGSRKSARCRGILDSPPAGLSKQLANHFHSGFDIEGGVR